jgi:hypothetical protein
MKYNFLPKKITITLFSIILIAAITLTLELRKHSPAQLTNAQMKLIIDESAESATNALSVIFASSEIQNPKIFKNINVEANITNYYLTIIKNLNILIDSRKSNYISEEDFHQAIKNNYEPVKDLMSIVQPQYESSISKFLDLSRSSSLESYFYNNSYTAFNSMVTASFWGNHGFVEKENQNIEALPWIIKAIYIIETIHQIQSQLPSNVEISPYNNNDKAQFIIETFMGTHGYTLFSEKNNKLQGEQLFKTVRNFLTPNNSTKLDELLTMLNDNDLSEEIKIYFVVK